MIKTLAEWNEQECLIVALPHEKTDWNPYLAEILRDYEEFVKIASSFQKVLLIAPGEKDFKPFAHFKNVEFFAYTCNDTWVRDFGAIDVLEDGRLKSLDFTFNAWGGKFESSLDNALNQALFSQKFKSKLESIALILEGGSVDFNGADVMLTSSHCLLNHNRNPHLSKEEIERSLKQIFGLKRIIWLNNGFILGDDTDRHIDTLARFIAEDTIAYCTCEDEKDPHFKALKAMEEELFKTGFKLLPMPLPKPIFYDGKRLGASYVNFVFVNGGLIMPFYGDENDERIQSSLAKSLPNRKVVGLDARVFLRQNGSLHCSCQNHFKGKRWT